MGSISILFGGKGLCGPQCSGLLLGRQDLIEAAMMNRNPREGAVCRPMKVGKEEIIGCLTALETWLNIDAKKLYAEWNGRVDRIRKLVDTVPGVETEIIFRTMAIAIRRFVSPGIRKRGDLVFPIA